MSADSGNLEKGCTVYFDGKIKAVRDWFFVSDEGCHNSDRIVIRFTDGTDNEATGWSKIRSRENCRCSEEKNGVLMCEGEGIRPGTMCGEGLESLCKSYNFARKSANFTMSTDPTWLKKLAEDDDCECCSAGTLFVAPTIGVSDFVKKRHLEHLQFTHYKGSWNDLIGRVNEQIALGNWSEGYRDGVRLVHMDKDEAQLFYGFDGFKKFEGMKMEAVVEKVPGREHEPAKLQIRILEPKIRMRYVDIILYRKDVLEEDGDPVTGADWEVISVNGRLNKNPPPMEAMTMVRNYRHLPGGTAMPGKDPVEFLDELMDAVLYEKGMKHLIKKAKK
jgi:hypothetical protein